jgi:hypothetical protein
MHTFMRHSRRLVVLPVALLLALVGTGGGLLIATRTVPSAHAAQKQEIDPSYANGTTVYMIGPHMITNPNPQLLAHAPELYILAYPLNASGCTSNCPAQTLPRAISHSATPASIPACRSHLSITTTS